VKPDFTAPVSTMPATVARGSVVAPRPIVDAVGGFREHQRTTHGKDEPLAQQIREANHAVVHVTLPGGPDTRSV